MYTTDTDQDYSDAISEKAAELFESQFLADIYDKISIDARKEIDAVLEKLAKAAVDQDIKDEAWEAARLRQDHRRSTANPDHNW